MLELKITIAELAVGPLAVGRAHQIDLCNFFLENTKEEEKREEKGKMIKCLSIQHFNYRGLLVM